MPAKKSTKKVAAKKKTTAKPKAAAKPKAKPAAAKKPAAKKAASPRKPKSAAAKKQPAKKAPAKKVSAKKVSAKKAPAKKTVAKKKSVAKPAKKSAVKKSAPPKKAGTKSKRKSTKSTTSSAISVPTASVTRSRSQRPNAFTLDDIDEILKGRPVSSSTTRTGKEKAARKVPSPKEEPEEQISVERRSHAPASLVDILGFDPNDNIKPEERALSEIPKKLHRYYKQLQRMRKELLESLEYHTEETLKRSAKEDSGDLSSYSQHQADAGTDNYDRDFALSLVSDEQELLFEVEEAIKRIHQGTYGICEVNGKPINRERLNAVPFARYSLEGQIEFEKTQRKKTHRGGIFDSALDDPSTFGGDDDGDD